MKVEIKIPSVGESVVEATVSNLIKPSGSIVAAEAEILELETEKVNQVLYAPQAGQISWNVKVGDVVKIGQVIGYIDTDAKQEAAPQPAAPAPAKPPEKKTEGPSARKMTPEFIEELKEKPKPTPRPAPAPKVEIQEGKATRKRMSGLRRTIAQKLVEVKNTTAMLTTFNEIDMTRVMEIRAKEKDNFQKKYGVKLGFMSFFVKASVAALKAYPDVNAQIDGEDILQFSTYDIGIAVGSEKGLFVPVVRNCEELSFGKIEEAIGEYAKKIKEGKIAIDDLKGGTFTITNGGTFGSLLSTPILNPPQSAILGMHAIVKRPMAVGDQVVIRPMMYVALSYDHRIIDGRAAVLFLVHLKESLEDPSRLLLDL